MDSPGLRPERLLSPETFPADAEFLPVLPGLGFAFSGIMLSAARGLPGSGRLAVNKSDKKREAPASLFGVTGFNDKPRFCFARGRVSLLVLILSFLQGFLSSLSSGPVALEPVFAPEEKHNGDDKADNDVHDALAGL